MRPRYGGNGQGPLETLEEPLYVSSPIGTRARLEMICRGCELEISGLPPTRRTALVLYFRGTNMIFFPRQFTSPGVRDS